MAEHVGEVACLECGGTAGVYADKRRWLYTNCHRKHGGDDCGINKYQSAKGQARIRARWAKEQPEQAAAFLGNEMPEQEAAPVPTPVPDPEPAPTAAEDPAPVPATVPKPSKPKRGMFRANREGVKAW
ncbi:MAG: hypothetical protein CL537_07770 [Alcanivoracaceae bacterium]|nr:hypothetical protein [Alcanivoracaceae bacterium]|tara:strand:- start:2595 stop:2978 length:384 start_codon:yes stop_codon:yes gene_type:complete